MNASQNAEQFHAQLAQYVPLFSPDYWPVWLVVAGLMLVGMWLVLALHAMLRFRAAHKTSAGHGEKVYLYSFVALVKCAAVFATSGQWPGQSLLCRQRTGNEKPAYRS